MISRSFKKDCNSKPKNAPTYGEFFGIDQLIQRYNIKNTKSIKKLLNLNVNCPYLKNYFNESELKEIEPLINLLLSKKQQPINDIIREASNTIESNQNKAMSPRAKDQDQKVCASKKFKPVLNADLLKKSELHSIEKRT